MILRSKRVYRKLIDLDPVAGTYIDLSDDPEDQVKISGVFDHLGGVLVVLYLSGGLFFIRVGEKTVGISSGIGVSVSGEPNQRRLSISDSTGEFLTLTYTTTDEERFENDFTPFIEDEDFDFGLYVANVTSSARRLKAALRNWS